MHSFAFTLIAATLATLSSAAPVALPASSSVSVRSAPAGSTNPLAAVANASSGPLNSVKGQAESVADAVHLQDPNSKIADAVKSIQSETPDVRARATAPSVAVIFNDILTEIQPYTGQLTYLVSSNLTVAEVTKIVASIKAPIVNAVAKLQALVGLEASVVLAPIEGDVELTVSQIATIVGGDLQLVLGAAGHVIDVVNAEGGDIDAEVKDVLVHLGGTVTHLVDVVVPLVDGLATSLAPLLAPVASVMSELGLVKLSTLLGVTH